MFDKVAKYYDIVMGPFDYQDLVDYLDDLIVEAGGERTDLLDIACGTAQEMVFFRQLGYQVTGLDLSRQMLDYAEEKHPGIEFIEADMSNFKTEEKYDNIICTFDSINYLTDFKKVNGCFKSVNKALNDNGLFLFDFNTVYGLIHEWEGIRSEDEEDYHITYESEFNYDNLVSKTRMKFFIKEDEEKFVTFEETHLEKGYTKEQISELLKSNGFKVIKIVPFLKKKGVKNSHIDRYQVVARKIK